MAYDTQDIFRLAQAMRTTAGLAGSSETRLRAVIGRAYYACFLAARDGLWGIDGKPSGAQQRRFTSRGSHDQEIAALAVHQGLRPGVGMRYKGMLQTLKDYRLAADYRFDDIKVFAKHGVASWDELADNSMALASQLLPDLRSLPRFR